MAFRSRRLARALALPVLCSSFVFPQKVFCVKQWALGDTERFDDKKSLCVHPIIPFETGKIYGFFDSNTKFLCIDGVGEINEDIFKNINVVPVKDVQSVSIGKDVIVSWRAFYDFVSLKNITIEGRRLRTQLTRKKGINSKHLIQHIDDLIPSPCKINDGALSSRDTLKKAIISNGIREIGKNAFENCNSLEEVQLPDSLLTIGECAFACCNTLKKIIIPKNVKKIGESAFQGCPSLEEVQLPDSLLTIGKYAFTCCNTLKKIIIPENVTEIESKAFESCAKLEEVQLPDSLLTIGDSAFHDCSALKKIEIPKNVKEIGDCAFESCNSLKEVQLPASLLNIGQYAFCDCPALESIRIPKNVTEIGDCAFKSCTSLVTVYVSRDAEIKIGKNAFPETANFVEYNPAIH